MTETVSISNLIQDLTTRSGRAILSQLGLRSPALREYLESLYAREPGEPGALLADPVLEATFGWKLAEADMEELSKSGLLARDLVSAMDQPPHDYKEYAFPRKRKPFQHQLDCWQYLLDDIPRSVLVASGTGSGKTECFLVPILHDLALERARTGGLTGVRALFLYPLNALINSQRDRLRAWCNGFGNDIRFCLYNGETPENVQTGEQERAGAEQLSREALRAAAAPVLVTNSTMLEYMLIRTQDQPVLEQSRGKLRWIVLDEAHTYIGSRAAEMTLLLRRVLHRFEVDPSSVRFVATSATIGDTDAEDNLRRFLADVSGAPRDRVQVVTGERLVPALPPMNSAYAQDTLSELQGEELFHALCHHPIARSIRTRLAKKTTSLRKLCRKFDLTLENTTALLDKVASSRNRDEVFLPLRIHLFHRAQRGLWVCINPSCKGREANMDSKWDFGALFPHRRTHCEHCQSPVFELVVCMECGQDYLTAQETFAGETGEQKLESCIETEDIDEFQLEIDPDDDSNDEEDDGPALTTIRRLVCGNSVNAEHIEDWYIDQDNSLRKEGAGAPLRLSPLATGPLACPCCGAKETHTRKRKQSLFRELRIGAPFALSTIVPTALEHTPPMNREAGLPSQGRRLLGFSDSRQGSARLAVRLQQEAERNRVRSILYHALAAERKVVDTKKLEQQIADLRKAKMPGLRSVLEEKKAELNRAQASSSHGTLSWKDAIERLKGDSSLHWMQTSFRYTSYLTGTPEEFADFCLYREFFHRPKRMNSAETMGLISLRYPALESRSPPPGWPLPLDHGDWTVFLKLVVDFFIRDTSAVQVNDDYLRWMGIPIRKRYLQGPGYSGALSSRQRRWPRVWRGSRPARMVRLLRMAANMDDSPSSDDRINEAFRCAWQALRPYLQQVGDGYLLKLDELAMLSELPAAEICPYTARVLDVTLKGLSPYLPLRERPKQCTPFTPPKVQQAYWRDASGRAISRKEIIQWLETDPDVQSARRLGVWSNLNDRVVANSPYFEVAEHSAQLDGPRLRKLEKRFKKGSLNILSCSTTMEMGVDIGGLSAIVMSNTPPNSANYLQRAGRAGRRGEGVSFAVTLCPGSPHGEQVFSNPLWPFSSTMSIPRVALDSARLVQRHVNSLCLGAFLEGRDAQKLKTGWFFQDDETGSSPGRQFIEWCRTDAECDSRLLKGLNHLVRGTALATSPTFRLLGDTASAMVHSMDAWQREAGALREDARQFGSGEKASQAPAVLAITRQLQRLEREYLLAELAKRQFLPGYGFPSGIVSFIPTTIDELKRRSKDTNDREDGFGKRSGYPSRQMEIAIREYAPGSEIVMDGRVYESAGVTLNWHIPPGVETLNEVQALRHVWRCQHCGATGDAPMRHEQCPHCNGHLKTQKYLEPAGFAVDIRYSPHNNVVSPTYVPVEPPWLSCPTLDWISFADPDIGRFRYSDSGHLFHGSRGVNGHGYAICLRCGRAASEQGPESTTELPEVLKDGHSRLRGGKDPSGNSHCHGSGFAIQRGLSLGGGSLTDVFELQLAGLHDDGTALSIGIALRRAFCHCIGIEEEEVGVAVRQGKASDETVQQSIFLYDSATGGNGYVAALRDHVAPALRQSVSILDCTKQCDAACHGCLLTYDTQYDSIRLDRHRALTFLSDEFLAGLELHQRYRILGPDSQALTRPLPRHLIEIVGEQRGEEIRIWLGGEPDQWDVDDFPLYRDILKWAGDERLVCLLVAPDTWAGLNEDSRYSLASMVSAGQGHIEVHAAPAPPTVDGSGIQLAVVGGSEKYVRWALSYEAALPMNADWGQAPTGEQAVYAKVGNALPQISTKAIPIDLLRPRLDETLAIIPIHKELNGRIKGFGSRFWSHIQNHCPKLKEQFEQGASLTQVSYSDRYVATPWACLLLREIFLDLVRAGHTGPETSLEVSTRELRRDLSIRRDWQTINDQWQDEDSREAFFRHLISTGRGKLQWEGPVEFETGAVPHFRELRLKWETGALWSLKLDQGVGYWWCRPLASFPFRQPTQEQLKVVNKDLRSVSQGNYPTYIYVMIE